MTNRFSIIHYLKILRPLDGFISGIGVIVGIFLAGGLDFNLPLIYYFSIFFAIFLLSGHAMVVNDIIDYDIDKINEPDRMLPSGKITKFQAKIYSILLIVSGLFLLLLLDLSPHPKIPLSSLWGLANILLVDYYNIKLKKYGIWGNLLVAYTAFAYFSFGDLFFNGRFTFLPLLFGSLSFILNLSREILKGTMDMEGDQKYGIKTVANVLGKNPARWISFWLLIICMSLVLTTVTVLGTIGRVGILVFTIVGISAAYYIAKSDSYKNAKIAKTIILFGPLLFTPFLIFDQIY